tara:strand:+ start:48 stop:212 length:165 start_codon:yes stop_codon:yes gene_type:complete
MKDKTIAILKVLLISTLTILGFYSGFILAFILSPIIIAVIVWFAVSINNNKKEV